MNTSSLRFSPSGDMLLHSDGQQVRVWDLLAVRLCHSCPGSLIGMARQGQSFLTCRAGGHYSAWDTVSGRELALADVSPQDYDFHQRAWVVRADKERYTLDIVDVLGLYPPQSLVWREYPEVWSLLPGRRLAVIVWGYCGRDATGLRIFDLDEGQALASFHAPATSRSLLPCDAHNMLICGADFSFDVYDLDTYEALHPFDTHTLEGNGAVAAISPQNRALFAMVIKYLDAPDAIHLVDAQAAASQLQPPDLDSTKPWLKRLVRQMNWKPTPGRAGAVVQILAEEDAITCLAFHPDGRQLASLLENGDVHLWDVESGELRQTLTTRPAPQRSRSGAPDLDARLKNWPRQPQRRWLAFHPSGALLFQETQERVNVWDVATGELRYQRPGALVGQARDGSTFLTLVNAEHCLAWDSHSGQETPLTGVPAPGYEFYQRAILTGRRSPPTVYVWDALGEERGRVLYSSPGKRGWLLENWIMAPNNRYVVMMLITQDEVASGECIDLLSGELVYTFRRGAYWEHVFFAAQHKRLVSCARGFEMYDLDTGQGRRQITESGGHAFAMHPRYAWLCAASSVGGASARDVRLFAVGDAAEPVEVQRVLENEAELTYLAFHPDGQYLACLFKGGLVKLWDIYTGSVKSFCPTPKVA